MEKRKDIQITISKNSEKVKECMTMLREFWKSVSYLLFLYSEL